MGWCWELISTTVVIVVTTIIYIKWSRNYWSRKGVLTGNAKAISTKTQSFSEILAYVYKNFKALSVKYCGYYIALQPIWIPLDLDLIKDILTTDFMHFTDHGAHINEKNDPLTGQLFMQNGTKWKNLRAKLTPTFTSGKIKMMFPTLLDCSCELINIVDKAASSNDFLDIKDITARYTTDVIGSCAFGLDCNSLKNPQSEFRIYGDLVFEKSVSHSLKHLISATFPWVLDVFRIPIFPKKVIDFFLRIVSETVNYRETNNIVRKDFMHLLIQLKNNVQIRDDDKVPSELNANTGGTALTIEELTGQAFGFFLAGFETSSTTLSFCLYELVTNSECQDQLRSEICNVYQKHGENFTYEALAEMKYMDKCINETLRKYPPLAVLMRQCTEDYKVPDSNLVIEKGTKVLIPILGIHRDPEYYPNPEQFDPERFSQHMKSERHPFAWLPFGEGPRICIGQRFGLMQTKVALAVLLQNHKFSLNKKTATPLVMDKKHIVLSPKGGIWLNVERIS